MKRIISKILRRIRYSLSLNRRIKASQWYYNTFPHLEEYESIQRNSDVLCIGSTIAKYAIDFKYVDGIIGSNLATLPETVYYDFQVVKNYHSYLKDGGVFIFIVCPFTLLKDKYTKEEGNINYLNIRYYPILHRALIDNFNYSLLDKWVLNPYKIGYKAWIRAFIDAKKSNSMILANNPLSDNEMADNARSRIEAWLEEFNLKDLYEPVNQNLQETINNNINILKQLEAFITERKYKGAIIIPPLSAELTQLLPYSFIESVLINPISQLNMPVISYLGKKEWMDKTFFRDSFTLNAQGRAVLTKDIINKLQII